MTTTIRGPLLLRRLAAVLVGVEAAALVGVCVWFAVAAVAREDATAMSAATAAMALAAGLALGWAAGALWRGAAWPRGLAITWQVLQCAAGVTVLEWSVAGGVATVVVGVAAGVVLVADARRDGPQASRRSISS